MPKSILNLPNDIWLHILEQDIYAEEFVSLRCTCKRLCDLVTPIIWSKLELYDVKQSTSFEYNAVEPNIASPVSHEGTYFSNLKKRRDTRFGLV